jgi:hypothetical protein
VAKFNSPFLATLAVSMAGDRRGRHSLIRVSPHENLIVVTMEQRWPYWQETEEALKIGDL